MAKLSPIAFRFSPQILPAIFLGLSLSSCEQKSLPPEPHSVYNWSEENLNILGSNRSSNEWRTFLAAALIPEDFSYRKSRRDFSDGQGPVFEIDKRNFETVRNIGITSSIADFCELDYEGLNFLPLMQWQRSQLPESIQNGYEIYVIGVAHGYAMGKTDDWLETNKIDCAKFSKDMGGRFFNQVFGRKF